MWREKERGGGADESYGDTKGEKITEGRKQNMQKQDRKRESNYCLATLMQWTEFTTGVCEGVGGREHTTTKGKGRGERTWFTPAGTLLCLSVPDTWVWRRQCNSKHTHTHIHTHTQPCCRPNFTQLRGRKQGDETLSLLLCQLMLWGTALGNVHIQHTHTYTHALLTGHILCRQTNYYLTDQRTSTRSSLLKRGY